MKPKILSKKCPYCKKVISSLYEKQLDYNMSMHLKKCKDKKVRFEDGVEDKDKS